MSRNSTPAELAEVAEQHRRIGAHTVATAARNTHPDAQWFPDAALGLFVHFGISAVHGGIDLSWSMMHRPSRRSQQFLNYGPHAVHGGLTPDAYWSLADRFDPRAFQPRRWLEAARQAGFSYAVFTTRHHDGYSMWPSASGGFGTATHLGGRDLVGEYVAACRATGLRVGLYYSPPDWHVSRSCMSFAHADAPPLDQAHRPRPVPARAEVEAGTAALRTHIRIQLEELLTRYGRIDLLWLDGSALDAICMARIRELQPGLVVNSRGHGVGDFVDHECGFPRERPSGWWDYCHLWSDGAWGYLASETYKPTSWLIGELMRARAWGGSMLANIAPRPDGEFPETAYRRLAELGSWLKVHGDAVLRAGPVADGITADVPLTGSGDRLFACLPAIHDGGLRLAGLQRAPTARLMATGAALPVHADGNGWRIDVDDDLRHPDGDIVDVRV